MSLYQELKRRNVFRFAATYIVAAWLLIQVAETIFPLFGHGDTPARITVIVLAIGFPLFLLFSWVFEITPEGLKKEKDLNRAFSVTRKTGKQLDRIIIVLLTLGLGYFAFDKFVLDPAQDMKIAETARQEGRSEALMESYGDKSIAVLPFVNMSDDMSNDYFSDGISEELLNLLTKIPDLRVISRSSSFSFKGKDIAIPEVAEQLDVAHVLEGSVRKAGNQVRITAQLIEARSDTHLWSETYDRTLDNIFQTQDEIAAAVVNALKVTLLGKAPKIRETNPEAYQLYLEGQYFGNQRTAESMARAIDLFKRALEIDPGYTPAWAELAYNYRWYSAIGGMPIDEGNALGDQAIEIALSTDAGYAWTYFVRGQARIFSKFMFKAGIEDWQYALQLDPGNAVMVSAAGTGARLFGRFDEAIKQYRTALEIDPVMPEIHSFLGQTYLYSGNLDEAEAAFRKALALSPLFAGARYRLGLVLIRKGEHSGALAELEQETGFVYRMTGLAMLHYALGNSEETQRVLNNLIANSADRAAYQIAEVYGVRGEVDKAFKWLEESFELRDGGLASILGDPALQNLTTDSRWEPFLNKLGLLEAWHAIPSEHGGPQK